MVTAKTGRPRRGGLVLTHLLTVREVALSGAFYADIFGGGWRWRRIPVS
jgi:hypothetical protein